jgi:chorismate mutase
MDEVDTRLVHLLNFRAQLSNEVARTKQRNRMPIHDRQREQQVLTRLCALKQSPLDGASLREIYRAIFRVSRRVQKRLD